MPLAGSGTVWTLSVNCAPIGSDPPLHTRVSLGLLVVVTAALGSCAGQM
jgi:hypothetical protein